MVGFFKNISVSTHHPPWRYLGVGIIKLVILMGFFGVSDRDIKGGVGPRNTHLTSQKFDCWIYGDNFVLSRSR